MVRNYNSVTYCKNTKYLECNITPFSSIYLMVMYVSFILQLCTMPFIPFLLSFTSTPVPEDINPYQSDLSTINLSLEVLKFLIRYTHNPFFTNPVSFTFPELFLYPHYSHRCRYPVCSDLTSFTLSLILHSLHHTLCHPCTS